MSDPLLLDGPTIAAQLRIPEGTLASWASRGALARRGHDARGRTLYDVDDVIALAATRRARRASRAGDLALARLGDSTTPVSAPGVGASELGPSFVSPRAWGSCSQRGCGTATPPGQSRCTAHARAADRARGTAAERGYDAEHEHRFRAEVLDRDPICVLCDIVLATVADHYPLSRRELVEAGLDPNDPAHGRGLCKRCHDRETAERQPGGWHAR